ncbi:phospholipase C/P1 nuclease domain-containing protein [Lentinula aciculospora]|uniref:Phospholipase C/P1 nuclease domain-containing protein n=1 Tax=Lentinula aciculospora TaxID=153920 RepID=A0A9W9ASN2_9AGAR|nr:phospholipase C/P1 nuclease domain-containing protein [Lentinula aciculospora]
MKLKLLSLALLIPRVFGWGAAGHEIVATIAQIHLHPGVLPVICEILNYTSTNPNEPPCHLAPVSTWADRFKYRMRWSAPLHYVGAKDDYPSETCAFPGERGWAGSKDINVLAGVKNVTSLLDAWVDEQSSSDDAAEEALKFLIHFIGDLHMPLHLTGRDRGGNSVKVRFDGRQTNLHSLWDGLLIAKTLRNVPRKYDRQLPIPSLEFNLRGAIYDGFIRQIMWEGILHDWKGQVPEWLACPSEQDPQSSSFSEGYSYPLSTVYNYVTHFGVYISSMFTSKSAQTDDSIVCPHFWAQSIHAMNCDFVWPKALDEPPYSHLRSFGNSDSLTPRPKSPLLELDTPGYSGYIAENRILEKLMAQAGIRLAGILNWLFADLAEADGVDGHLGQRRQAEARRRVKELSVNSLAQT